MNDSYKTQFQKIKAQFLEEAQQHLQTLESNLLGISRSNINRDKIDLMLRSAHSLKGGAAMMEFNLLSEFSHRLEDFFKILKVGKVTANEKIEQNLLMIIDFLLQLVDNYRQSQKIEPNWIKTKVEPIFSLLHQLLGDFNDEDEELLLSQNQEINDGDMSVFLFETEIEEGLTNLETLLTQQNEGFSTELFNFLQELSGVALMLELSSLSQLCTSIETHLKKEDVSIFPMGELALQQLRRSQSLVLSKQKHLISDHFILPQEKEEKININEQNNHKISEKSPSKKISLSLKRKKGKNQFITSKKETETLKVFSNEIEELNNLFGELNLERNSLNLQLKNLRNLTDNLNFKIKELYQNNIKLRTLYDQISISNPSNIYKKLSSNISINNVLSTSESFDLLEMDTYTDLHLITGEMMENIVKIIELNSDLDLYLKEAEKINREITRTSKLMQNNLDRVKMRPFSDLLQKFPRALRQMEMEYEKQVQLQIKGGLTLIEKNILEKLNDPLLHLFRNAFDHGIENPSLRQELGKPPEGIIEISAAYRGNQTIITIRDDGKGIDIDKIREKAQKMGLNPENIAKMSDQDLLELIFTPSFSTSSQVTALSGRGVGMDVVKQSIDEIGGDIQVDTELGIGTTFTLKVPFTLSVIRVLLVESQNLLLAFPSNLIEEVKLLNFQLITTIDNIEYFKNKETKIKLIPLSKWLQFNYSPPILETESIPIINQSTVLIIDEGDSLVGLQVERYWGEQEVTIRQIEGNFPLPLGFNNCTILGDGRVVPLIDPLELLNWIENEYSSVDIDKQKNFTATENTIMVIDDSINVRQMLALTLEKANYQVEQAKDGEDALVKLKQGRLIKAIICDIEMPRLDGFGFLANVKNEPHLQQIPVIMLTSRTGEKHHKMAMNLGADDYFSKPFPENQLLNRLAELIV
jgi:two-component system, chemotaxis family, sensor histidine kinase and response regulator PixL